jgi:signal transduction histidine kinase
MNVPHSGFRSTVSVSRWEVVAIACLILGILASRLHSFLLFHTLVELFTLSVGFISFSLAWSTRRYLEDGFLRVAGLATGPTAIVTLLHTLTYKGIGVFPDLGANLATQLWIALRLLQAGSFLAATTPRLASQPAERIVVGFGLAAAAFIVLIFSGTFPACYVEGLGLTPFKIGAEYAVMAILALAALRLWRDPTPRNPTIKALAIAMLAASGLESMAFTLYVDVYGAMNMIGHVLALICALLIYTAVAWVGLAIPQDALYASQQAAKNQFRMDAERANQDIVRFAEVLAHHLQEPVRQQYVYCQRLAKVLQSPLPEDARTALDYVQAGALRQRTLVRDALRYLSVARSLPCGPPCDANMSLDTALYLLRSKIAAADARIERAPLPHVRIDQDRLAEVFAILIDNAITFRKEEAALVISVTATKHHPDGIVLSVTDNGPGIPKEFHERIFRVFERLTGIDAAGGSTGIGLALAKRIIEAADGKIWVETAAQGGTAFHVLLKTE